MGLRAIFVLATVFLWLGQPQAAEAKRRYAAIVVDHATGETLHAHDADVELYPASLTKMMTLYMVFDALDRGEIALTTRWPISKRSAGMPASKLGLKAGRTITVEEVVLALAIKSANDAAVVAAEALGGSEAAFALEMTRRAAKLGLKRTAFRNASGLPDTRQRSTARDMARLSRRLIIDHGAYYDYFSRKSFRYNGRTYTSHNRLMAKYAGMDGLKTGYIRASGFNLAATAVRDGRRVTVVVFGGRTSRSRDAEVARLLDLGFAKVRNRPLPLLVAKPPLPKPPLVAAPPAGRPGTVVAALDDALPGRPLDTIKTGAAPGAILPAIKAPAAERDVAMLGPVPMARPGGLRLRTGAPKAAATGGYGVQVGAYHDPEAARRRAYEAARRVPGVLLQGDVQVSALAGRRATVYRARFVGLERPEALQACDALERAAVDCLVIRTEDVQLARN